MVARRLRHSEIAAVCMPMIEKYYKAGVFCKCEFKRCVNKTINRAYKARLQEMDLHDMCKTNIRLFINSLDERASNAREHEPKSYTPSRIKPVEKSDYKRVCRTILEEYCFKNFICRCRYEKFITYMEDTGVEEKWDNKTATAKCNEKLQEVLKSQTKCADRGKDLLIEEVLSRGINIYPTYY